jgi:hypothetical protein
MRLSEITGVAYTPQGRRLSEVTADTTPEVGPTFPGGGGGEFRGRGATGSWAPETLGEKIKGTTIVDVLAHIPFSPLHDYERKGAAVFLPIDQPGQSKRQLSFVK